MRLKSQESFDAASERLEALIASTTDDLKQMAIDMLFVVDTLGSNSQLRLTLTDPAADGDAKAKLVELVFGGSVSSDVLDFVKGVSRSYWSEVDDLVETIGRHAAIAVLADAERVGILPEVAEELFSIEQFMMKERTLRDSFSNKLMPPAQRIQLIEDVLEGSVHEHTMMILRRMVSSERHPGIISSLRTHTRLAAERRDRLVAVVSAALPLTTAQVARIERLLTSRYGKKIQVHVQIDPDIVGGMRIVVGDDVMDGTLASRIDAVRRQLTD
ncbi:MAG TPA: F0F1 ATP synthase subunit delta [Actinomycetaceae bacterium]|nr:F0F1 ATP synthase subunit delta [Actinomycetaceae bacterium]